MTFTQQQMNHPSRAAVDSSEESEVQDETASEGEGRTRGGTSEREGRTGGGKRKRSRPVSTTSCGCWLKKAMIEKYLKKGTFVSDEHGVKALQRVGQAITKYAGISPENLCKYHARNLGKLLKVYTTISHRELTSRLDVLFSESVNEPWDTIRNDYAEWFETEDGDPLPPVFRFEPTKTVPLVATWDRLTHLDFKAIVNRCFPTAPAATADVWKTMWDTQGCVTFPVFEWLFDDWDGDHPDGLAGLFEEEFDLYDWHYRPRDHVVRAGNAKNMWFSLIQQLIRQDPVYYMLHVLLRPDHQWRLVSFPFYTKSAYPEEATGFRRLDFDVTDLIGKKRCVNQIRGSVAMLDEDDDNCTEVLGGMDSCLAQWWADLSSRNVTENDLRAQITPAMWTPADETKYGLKWGSRCLVAGEALFTLPTTPYGSTGPATTQMRSISPCFVGVREDHNSLDCLESGSWGELSACHRDFTSPAKTPSGQSSAKGGGSLPYAFAASTQLTDLGYISNALVGRERWTSVNVVRELDILFGLDNTAATLYINNWRTQARERYIAAMENLRAIEGGLFGANSFVKRSATNLPTVPLFLAASDGDGGAGGAGGDGGNGGAGGDGA